MKNLALLTLIVGGVACQSDTRNLERKLDELNKKVDTVLARGGGGGGPGAAGARQPQQRPPEPDRAKTYGVPIDGDPFDGPADAKVTIVKAYDYACGYCEKARPTMDKLREKYGNDLRVVYKQLVIHPKNALVPALAFCAAAKQGKHKEMDHLIWEKSFLGRALDLTEVPLGPPPEKPADGSPPARPQTVKCWDHPDGCKSVNSHAAELGLNMDKFKSDLKGECQQFVQNDAKQLGQFGLSSTPSFFVNGRYVAGAQQVEIFSALIDEELKKANERIAAGTPAAAYYQQWIVDKGLKALEKQ